MSSWHVGPCASPHSVATQPLHTRCSHLPALCPLTMRSSVGCHPAACRARCGRPCRWRWSGWPPPGLCCRTRSRWTSAPAVWVAGSAGTCGVPVCRYDAGVVGGGARTCMRLQPGAALAAAPLWAAGGALRTWRTVGLDSRNGWRKPTMSACGMPQAVILVCAPSTWFSTMAWVKLAFICTGRQWAGRGRVCEQREAVRHAHTQAQAQAQAVANRCSRVGG